MLLVCSEGNDAIITQSGSSSYSQLAVSLQAALQVAATNVHFLLTHRTDHSQNVSSENGQAKRPVTVGNRSR